MGLLCPRQDKEEDEEEGEFEGVGHSVIAVGLAKRLQSDENLGDGTLRTFINVKGQSDNTPPANQLKKKLKKERPTFSEEKEERPKFSEEELFQRIQGMIDANPTDRNFTGQKDHPYWKLRDETQCWLLQVGFSIGTRRYPPQNGVTVDNMHGKC